MCVLQPVSSKLNANERERKKNAINNMPTTPATVTSLFLSSRELTMMMLMMRKKKVNVKN